MTRFYGCDAYKNYSLFTWVDEAGGEEPFFRVKNERSEFRDYLGPLPSGSLITLETGGNWSWMVEEMEKAGAIPLMTNVAKAKAMMGKINKTDKLDSRGLATFFIKGGLANTPPDSTSDYKLGRDMARP